MRSLQDFPSCFLPHLLLAWSSFLAYICCRLHSFLGKQSFHFKELGSHLPCVETRSNAWPIRLPSLWDSLWCIHRTASWLLEGQLRSEDHPVSRYPHCCSRLELERCGLSVLLRCWLLFLLSRSPLHWRAKLSLARAGTLWWPQWDGPSREEDQSGCCWGQCQRR